MRIMILPQIVAEGVSGKIPIPHAIISIVSPGADDAIFDDNVHRKGELHLKFYDVDFSSDIMTHSRAEMLKIYGPGKFTEEHAEQILTFVKEAKDKIQLLICHCEAGVSRSAAVAAAISLIFKGSDKEVFDDKGYLPNMYVYRTILNVYHK